MSGPILPLPTEALLLPGDAKEKPAATVIRELEEEIMLRAGDVVLGALDFAKLDPEAKEPPEEWVAAYGKTRAEERFRTARYALLPAKDAPIGVRLAKEALVGVAKARAAEKLAAQPVLNLRVTELSITLPVFPVLEVEQ